MSQSPEPVAVSVRNVRKTFRGGVTALHDISLDVARGEFFSLLGPSGCGKTTLLRMIGGFEEPSAGDILIEGRSVLGVPPYARPTNMIFQNLALFPHLNVFENVAFALRIKKQSASVISQRVEQALALVRLEGYAARPVDKLSGGQRQRVALARALVNDPPVLLLDEPLGALDLQLRLQMQQELRQLQRAVGATFIFVTHDQGEAMSMSDRIAVMDHGEIVQVGTPETIYNDPATRFVAAFIGSTNLLEGSISSLDPTMASVDCNGITFQTASHADLRLGQNVTVALRYERLELRPDGPVGGVVTDRSFLGNMVRLAIRLPNGLALYADIPASDSTQVSVGGDVTLGWTPGSPRLLAG